MKNIVLLIGLLFFISNCSDTPSAPKKDTEYNLDGVRIIIPSAYQPLSSFSEIQNKISTKKDTPQLDDQLLLDRMAALNKNDNHLFAKFEGQQLELLSLKTDGAPVIMNKENSDYLLKQFENNLEDNFSTDSTYSFRLLQEKLSGANRVKYFKFQYFHKEKKLEWYSTNYLIYANSRTIKLSIISPNQNHNDLENYMQFIQIK